MQIFASVVHRLRTNNGKVYVSKIYWSGLIFGGIKLSTCSKKWSLIKASNKRRGHLLIFRFFPDHLEHIGTLPRLLIFRVCKAGNYFSSFWTELTLNWSTKEFALFKPIHSPLLALNGACKCLSIYETSSWTLRALQCLHLKAKK